MKPAIFFFACIATVASENLYLWNAELSCPDERRENVSAITVVSSTGTSPYKLFAPAHVVHAEIRQYGYSANGQCLPGFYMDSTSKSCVLCPVGFWCKNEAKTKCIKNGTSTKNVAASEPGQCVCIHDSTQTEVECNQLHQQDQSTQCAPGFYGKECRACPLGFICTGGGKKACPIFSTTQKRASTRPEHCTCAPGFRQSVFKSVVVCIPDAKTAQPRALLEAPPGAPALVWENTDSGTLRRVVLHVAFDTFDLEITMASGKNVPRAKLSLCTGKAQCQPMHMDIPQISNEEIQVRILTASSGPVYLLSEIYMLEILTGRVVQLSTSTPPIPFPKRRHELYFRYIAVRNELLVGICVQTRADPVEVQYDNAATTTLTNLSMFTNITNLLTEASQMFFENTTTNATNLPTEASQMFFENTTTNATDVSPGPQVVRKDCDLKLLHPHTFVVLQTCSKCVSETELEHSHLSEDAEHIVINGGESLSLNHNFLNSAVDIDTLHVFERFQAGTILNFSNMNIDFLQISNTIQQVNMTNYFSLNFSDVLGSRHWKIPHTIPKIVYYQIYESPPGRARMGSFAIQHTLYPLYSMIDPIQTKHTKRCLHGYLWGADTQNSACVSCPPNYLCKEGNIVQHCPNGTLNHRCACTPGMYWNVEAFACVKVPRGWYTNTTDSLPIQCPPHSNTAHDGASNRSMCKCDKGYYQAPVPGIECRQARIGNFAVNGQETRCELDETTLYPGSSSVADCVCRVGFKNRTHCEQCAVNEHCPENTNGTPRLCLENELQTPTSGKCQCKPGYARDIISTKCEPVERGFYVNEQVSLPKTQCPPGFTTVQRGQSSLINCVCAEVGRVKREQSMHCVCDTKHYLVHGRCTPCPPNMHTANKYDARMPSDCICMDGFEKNETSFACEPCDIGFFCKDNKKYACPAYTYGIMYGQKNIENCIECGPLDTLNHTIYTLPSRVGPQTSPPFLGCALHASLHKRTRDLDVGTGYYQTMTGFHTFLSRTILHHNGMISTFNRHVLDLQLKLKELFNGYDPFEKVETAIDTVAMRVDLIPHDDFFAHLFARLAESESWQTIRPHFSRKYPVYIEYASFILCKAVSSFFGNKTSAVGGARTQSQCISNSVHLDNVDIPFEIMEILLSHLEVPYDTAGFVSRDPVATRDVFHGLPEHLRTVVVVVPVSSSQLFILPVQNSQAQSIEYMKTAVQTLENFDFHKLPCAFATFERMHQASEFCDDKYHFHTTHNFCQRCHPIHQFYDDQHNRCKSCSSVFCGLGESEKYCCANKDAQCTRDESTTQAPSTSTCRNDFHELEEECDPTDKTTPLHACCSASCTFIPGFYRFPPCNTVCGDGIIAINNKIIPPFREVCEYDF